MVIFFIVQSEHDFTNFRDLFRDIILCISFLSFFIIQRAINKSTTAIHKKMNELIATYDKARDELLTIEEKTGTELDELINKHKKKTEVQIENNGS